MRAIIQPVVVRCLDVVRIELDTGLCTEVRLFTAVTQIDRSFCSSVQKYLGLTELIEGRTRNSILSLALTEINKVQNRRVLAIKTPEIYCFVVCSDECLTVCRQRQRMQI